MKRWWIKNGVANRFGRLGPCSTNEQEKEKINSNKSSIKIDLSQKTLLLFVYSIKFLTLKKKKLNRGQTNFLRNMELLRKYQFVISIFSYYVADIKDIGK